MDLLQFGRECIIKACQELGLSCEEIDEDKFSITTKFGYNFSLYLSLYGPNYYLKKYSWKNSRLKSSRHCVVFIYPNTEFVKIKGFLNEYIEALQRGHESEQISTEALKRLINSRGDIFAEGHETGDSDDIEGADFRIGIWHPWNNARIFWFDLQVKSSFAARQNTIAHWKDQRQNGNGKQTFFGYPRRVISVPREGEKEVRIQETMRRILKEAEFIRDRLNT